MTVIAVTSIEMITSHKLLRLILSVYFLAAFIPACSSPPSLSDAQKELEARINRESKGIIKLISFSESNGHEANVFGKKIYIFDYEAEIEFNDDCYWGGPAKGFEVKTWVIDPSASSQEIGTKYTKGQREKISGKLRFELTDSGWRGEVSERSAAMELPANRDMIVNELLNIAGRAYEYRQRPATLGGGGGSYVGFEVPDQLAPGVKIVSLKADQIVIEKQGVRGTVDRNGMLRTD